MGQTLSTTVGVGFRIPDEVISRLTEEDENFDFDDFFYAGGYIHLSTDLSYYYDYSEEGRYVYIVRLTKTFYDGGFNELPWHEPTTLRAEAEEILDLAHRLGYPTKFDYPKLTKFVETSLG